MFHLLANLDFVFLVPNHSQINEHINYYHGYLPIFITIIFSLLFLQNYARFFVKNRKWFHVWDETYEEVLNILSQAANDTLLTFFKERFNCTPWFVSVIHTFWAALNRNPHIHFIVTAWWYNLDNDDLQRISSKDKFMAYPFIIKLRRAKLAKYCREYGKQYFSKSQYELFDILISKLFCKDRCVFFSTKVTNKDVLVGYLGRYLKRPVIWKSRILNYNWTSITYTYFDKHDKTEITHTEPAYVFLWKLTTHIPDKYFKCVRYWWLFANRCKQKYLSVISQISVFWLLVSNKKQYIAISYRERLILTYWKDPFLCSCWSVFCLTEIRFDSS